MMWIAPRKALWAVLSTMTALSVTASATAASISTAVETFLSRSANLTAEGTIDWMQFGGYPVAGFGSSVSAEKLGGADLSVVFSQADGVTNVSATSSSWTDGDPALVVGPHDSGWRFTGRTVIPRGISIDAQADTTDRLLQLFVGTEDGVTGELRATVFDVSNTPISTEVVANLGPNSDAVYKLTFNGDNPGDYVRVNWSLSAISPSVSSSRAAYISAVTLAVPEPTLATLVTPFALLARRQRR
ncbi:MAG: hypothetical protein AAGJ38_02845 [Planctomycetota bacterium]